MMNNCIDIAERSLKYCFWCSSYLRMRCLACC